MAGNISSHIPKIKKQIKITDLFNGKPLNLKDQEVELNISVPDSDYQVLLEQMLERDYLNNTSDRIFLKDAIRRKGKIHWLQITRLPIHPNENESYDLLSRWQGVLSSLHAWDYRLIFLLLRREGKTKLFLGTVSPRQEISTEEALEQMREATFGSMPGMGLRTLDNKDTADEIAKALMEMNHIGAVTGIPSFRENEKRGMLQTLDQLAFGIQDKNGREKDYAMVVISDPISDKEISDVISRYRRLGSQIHTEVKTTGSQTMGQTEEEGKKVAGTVLGSVSSLLRTASYIIPGGTLLQSALKAVSFVGSAITGIGGAAMSREKGGTVSGSASINKEYLDKFAEYAESVTEHHIKRLNEGRNLGFWNTGVYVLGQMPRDVVTVTGMLRSIYSGDESYFEPIRLHLFNENSNAKEIVTRYFELLPMNTVDLSNVKTEDMEQDLEPGNWHILGKIYQYLSTPINTKELSLATSLPRRDVPGLRFVKTAVRFANNPAVITGDKITLGNIVDTGIVQNSTYDIDVNSLVRHALVAGSTGSGKSTTCKRILSEVIGRDIPVMVIEPAKDDYVRWAIEMNKRLPKEKQFKIYMPGVAEFEGTPVEELKLNPFEPAAVPGVDVNLLQHCENFAMLLNACLPSEDVVPILIEEAVDETIRYFAESCGRDYEAALVEPMTGYPDIDAMLATAQEIMKHKNYHDMNKSNLTEVLLTRFKYLRRGMRGKILNVSRSTDYHKLFSGNVIINISRLAGSRDKSLIMSLLMQALYEYRASRYGNDPKYRARAQKNELCHLTLVEEAHNVLLKPQPNVTSGSPQKAASDLFDSMLSEIREYGQGLVVVDQVPTRLIEGATKNTNYKIVHRLTAPDDQEVMAACMAFRDDQKYIIPTLEKGNAIICGDEDDAATWVKIPAPGQGVKGE